MSITDADVARLAEISRLADEGWWAHEGDIFVGAEYVGRNRLGGFAEGNPIYFQPADLQRAHAVVDAISLLPGLLAERERLMKVVAQMVRAIEGGNIDSPEIDGPDDYPPHRWHEEWLHYARDALRAAGIATGGNDGNAG